MADNPYTPDDKLHWEIAKLQAETKNLKQTWIRNPASWFTIITTLVALTGVVIQYVKSDGAYQLIQIKAEQLKLETQQIEQQNATLKSAREQLRAQIKIAERELATIKANPSSSADNQAQLQQSQEAITTLNAALKPTDSGNEFVAVIATLRTVNLALNRADTLSSKGVPYPVEVYQKGVRQFTLTLGGKVTYNEAVARVNYAKQNGYPDAVVRLAVNWQKQ
ncbi:hypothetical protein [Spirosoma arcticum]